MAAAAPFGVLSFGSEQMPILVGSLPLAEQSNFN
jgi:hypothetical protein